MFKPLSKTSFVLISSLLITSQAYAVGEGFYMGIKLGPASNSGNERQVQTTSMTTTPATPSSTQFGSRLFMGNKFNKYASMEFGLNYFSKIKYDTKNVPTCSTPAVRVRDFDVTFKGDYAFSSFDVFGKAGVAFTYFDESGSLNPDLSKPCGDSNQRFKYAPTFSVGASYGLTQNWVVDVSMDNILMGGAAKSVQFYGLGISYHFVNVYCGQFLC